MRRLPNTCTHEQQWESNPRPVDLDSNALSAMPHAPLFSTSCIQYFDSQKHHSTQLCARKKEKSVKCYNCFFSLPLQQNECFVDTKNMAIVKKLVKHLDQQDPFESRRLWKDVTRNLKNKDVDTATEHKRQLEQRQRDEAKDRKETGAPIINKVMQKHVTLQSLSPPRKLHVW